MTFPISSSQLDTILAKLLLLAKQPVTSDALISILAAPRLEIAPQKQKIAARFLDQVAYRRLPSGAQHAVHAAGQLVLLQSCLPRHQNSSKAPSFEQRRQLKKINAAAAKLLALLNDQTREVSEWDVSLWRDKVADVEAGTAVAVREAEFAAEISTLTSWSIEDFVREHLAPAYQEFYGLRPTVSRTEGKPPGGAFMSFAVAFFRAAKLEVSGETIASGLKIKRASHGRTTETPRSMVPRLRK